jgi:hypothetical protein
MPTVSLTALLSTGIGNLVFSRDKDHDFLVPMSFSLAAGAMRTISIDPVLDAGAVAFLAIKAATATGTLASVSYGFSDSDAQDPPNGLYWKLVDGMLISWETQALSDTDKMYVYNQGAAAVDVTLLAGFASV